MYRQSEEVDEGTDFSVHRDSCFSTSDLVLNGRICFIPPYEFFIEHRAECRRTESLAEISS